MTLLRGLPVVLVIVYFGTYFWLLPYLHDQTLQKFFAGFIGIPVPSKTQEIDEVTEVGQQ